MKGSRYPWKYLDGEKLFKYYFGEMGQARSCGRLAKWCGTQGMKNPKTGKLPTAMAVWFAMWRWALLQENQKTAHLIYNNSLKDVGQFCSVDDWLKLLKDKASVCLNSKAYAKWCKANGC